MANKTEPAAQVAFAKKAAALKAASPKRVSPKTRYLADAAKIAEQPRIHQHDCGQVHAPRAPPDTRLLSKSEVLAIVGVTYPSLWAWMRAGSFPRSRIVGGKSMWLSTEIDAWLAGLPLRPLKGDDAIEENDAA
jgi:predicted DNA-binding transcriptional regulator AlpA